MTKSLDVIGHELTHGVTEKEAGLQYLNQSGALNEYDVTVVAGERRHHVRLGEREIDERLRPLIECLEPDARPAAGRPR